MVNNPSNNGMYAMVFREHLPSLGNLLDTSMAYASGEMVPPQEK
jgi:hypothetical protein